MRQGHGGEIYGKQNIRLDFSVNTNPFGMPEKVKQAVIGHPEAFCRYPDSSCSELREKLAWYYNEMYGKQEQPGKFVLEDFICGNGAADLLYSLIFALKPERALLFVPCFSEYEAALEAVGCEVNNLVLREEDGFAILMEEQLSCLSSGSLADRADLMILGNPNNPTGKAVCAEEIRKLAVYCLERGIFLVLDECFNWFLQEPLPYSLAAELDSFPNVMILNAFTKIFSMAGLRLGFGICRNREIHEGIGRCRQPWSVSGTAMTAGIQALSESEYVIRSREYVKDEKEFLAGGLERLGLKVFSSDACYILFKSGRKRIWEELRDRGILIRSCENYAGLGDGYYRVAVKRHEENRELLECMGGILRGDV